MVGLHPVELKTLTYYRGLYNSAWVGSLIAMQAALFLWFIKANIIYTPDKIAAARKWVPVLVGII